MKRIITTSYFKLNVFMRVLFAFLLLSLAACTAGKKALQRGDYYDAVLKAVNRLRSNPGQEKAKASLKQAYPLALEILQDNIKQLEASTQAFKYEQVVNEYGKINRMYQEIRRAPGALAVVQPANMASQADRAKQNAAADRFNAGQRALSQGTREAAKQAYNHFNVAKRYMANYPKVDAKIQEALDVATLKVVVEPIPLPSQRYQFSADFFQKRVAQYLLNQNISRFVRFYVPSEANTGVDYPDQILKLRFDDFLVGQTNTYQKETALTRDSIKVGEVKLDSGVVRPVYGTVKATLTTFNKEIISKGLLNLEIQDVVEENVVLNQSFPGQHTWRSSWATFQGDERALSDEQLALCRKKELSSPAPERLFVKFTEPIYSSLVGRLKDFYRNY